MGVFGIDEENLRNECNKMSYEAIEKLAKKNSALTKELEEAKDRIKELELFVSAFSDLDEPTQGTK